MQSRRGFTLIEIVITMALIVIITGIYLLAANPGNQLAESRNNKRLSDLQVLINAIHQEAADQSNEQFSCPSAGSVPTSTTRMKSGAGGYNIAPCIVYTNGGLGLFAMPMDPTATGTFYTSTSSYDSGYSISMNSTTGQITVSAPFAELGKTISITQ